MLSARLQLLAYMHGGMHHASCNNSAGWVNTTLYHMGLHCSGMGCPLGAKYLAICLCLGNWTLASVVTPAESSQPA
jgi:hypothetical protein